MTLDKRSFMLGLMGNNIALRLQQVNLISDDSFKGCMKDLLENKLGEKNMSTEEYELLSIWSEEIYTKLNPNIRKIIEQRKEGSENNYYTQ